SRSWWPCCARSSRAWTGSTTVRRGSFRTRAPTRPKATSPISSRAPRNEPRMNATISLIAEIGSVHDGSFGNGCKLIEAAAACGADAVKFQTHIAEAETLRDAPMPPYFKGEPRFEYFQRTAFTLTEWHALKKHCAAQGVAFLSSPFSIEAIELLE